MNLETNDGGLRLGLPKGRMQAGIFTLLDAAGLTVRAGLREYRPTIADSGFNVKILKPQSIVEMLAAGSRDVGFAGADWVRELDAELIEVLDTGFDPVDLVAAAPAALLDKGPLASQPGLVVATEYPRLTAGWLRTNEIDARIVHSWGATEVFPPDDADLIVDNSATGATLVANGLLVVDTLMRSSTRLYAHPRALDDAPRRAAIEALVMMLSSVLEARGRVMVEVNVTADRLEAVCAALPCMREPTISALHASAGFAIKAAVPRADLARLVPCIKAAGGSDIVITALTHIVP
ncbi:MAG: ATP phosphoribosyltransferase [Gemmatimonadales bacterium]|nr:ATP phosphoribosyltransferase [Gemmatimonadales bacterium]